MIEHKSHGWMIGYNLCGELKLGRQNNEIEWQTEAAEHLKARGDIRPHEPSRVWILMNEVSHSDQVSTSAARPHLFDLTRHIPFEGNPADNTADRTSVGNPKQVACFDWVIARLHDNRAVGPCFGLHPFEIGFPEVGVDCRHGRRVDPRLRRPRPPPQMSVGVDNTA
jgi:hypothetical protein